MMPYYWDYGSGGNDAFSIAYTVFVLVLVFVGAVITVHYLRRDLNGKPGASEESALDVLKKRYARGEIDKKEFLQKKKDLSK